MKDGLLYLLVNSHRFILSSMLDTGITRSFVNHKLAEKLPLTIQTTKSLTITLQTGKTLAATMAINLDMLIDDFVYT